MGVWQIWHYIIIQGIIYCMLLACDGLSLLLSCDHIFHHFLPCILGCLLHEPLDPEALDVHVSHGGVTRGGACLPEHLTGFAPILVLHVVPEHLGAALQPVVNCSVTDETSSGRIHQVSHGPRLLVAGRYTGVGSG